MRRRPAEPADREFLLAVYGSTREAELSVVDWPPGAREEFVRQQFDAQATHYRSVYPAGEFDVVEVDGERAGRIYVNRGGDETRIVDIALLPPFRGRGVGTALVSAVLEEAADAGRPVTIHVEHFNPARAWYERLGFQAVSAGPVYLLMRWSPGAGRDRERP